MTIPTMSAPPADEPLDAVIARMEAAMAKDAGVGTKAAAYWNADVQRLIDAARHVAAPVEGAAFDLVAHLHRQREFSARTFGPGKRTAGVVDHIRKELKEIEADPDDIAEWVDVVILAFDGAWRAGWEPEEIVRAIVAKQTKNEGRTWPDWRTADPDKAIEHDRTRETASPAAPATTTPETGDG